MNLSGMNSGTQRVSSIKRFQDEIPLELEPACRIAQRSIVPRYEKRREAFIFDRLRSLM
jgi:hypothetical protein